MLLIEDQVLSKNGRETIRGCDKGMFPRHHFSYYSPPPGQVLPPLYLRFAGRDEWIPGCYRKRDNSRFHIIEVLSRGRMIYSVEGRSFSLGPGDAVLIPKNSVSSMVAEIPSEKWVMCVEGSLADSLMRLIHFPGRFFFNDIPPENGIHRIEKMDELLIRKESDWLRRVSSLCYEFLQDLSSLSRKDERPPVMIGLQDFIDRSLDAPLCIEDLCREAHKSRSSLNRLFSSCIGVSPMEYVIDRRMSLARDLLLNTSLSIKEIASRAGYADPLYFSNEFKKRCAVSPRAFRQGRAAD